MEVIALVGPSGTGKSHRALLVAHNNQADAIIDDGLLIKDGKIIAGKSAKREQNKVLAVKRAIFVLPGHAEEVRKAIEETKPVRILILGTSENMARKIAKALKLPEISHFVHIEEIATQSEMEKARFHRLREGKHIPTLVQNLQTQVRKDVEYMTGMVVKKVNITIKALFVQPKRF